MTPSRATDERTVRARRRVIDLALARRPEMELDDLVEVLRRLEVPVDRATLLSDLDALGFDVDDEPAAPPPPPAPAPAPPTGPYDAYADPPAPAAPGRRRRAVPAVAVAAAVLVVGISLGLPDEEGDGPAPATASGAPETAAPEEADDGPGRDAALADTADLNLALAFTEEAEALPVVDDLGDWSTPRGLWAQADGHAAAELDEGGALAWLPAPGPDLRVEVAVGDDSPNAGLALRVVDDDSYLAWVIAPTYSIVNLWRVTDGVRTLVGNSGLTAADSGRRIGAHLVGADIELLVGGEVVATYTDSETTGATGVGLVVLEAGPDAAEATFDDLRVRFGG